jgi:hypothetical protein
MCLPCVLKTLFKRGVPNLLAVVKPAQTLRGPYVQLVLPLGADLRCKVLASLTRELQDLGIHSSDVGACGGLDVCSLLLPPRVYMNLLVLESELLSSLHE